ncbi:MAG: DUF4340 domain-containing protein [Alphaproteobacteria bacterium]
MKTEAIRTTGPIDTRRVDRNNHWFGSWGLLLACALIVAGFIGTAGWMLSGQEAGSIAGFTRADGSPILPAASSSAERIRTIRIESQGNAITLQRDGDQWQLASSSGYPIPEDRVDSMLKHLGELRAAYVSEDSPPRYNAYGLDGADNPSGHAARISVEDGDGKPIGSITTGAVVTAPGAVQRELTATMRPNDSRIWLAEGNLKVISDPLQWTENRITDVPKERVQSLTTTAPDGRRLAIGRDDTGNGLQVTEGLPPGAEPAPDWALDPMFNVLDDLRFADVQRIGDFDPLPADVWKATWRTAGGLTYDVALIREDMGTWGQFRATANTDAPAAQAAAERFNARHRNWAYLLNESVARHLMARPEDLTGKR